MSTLTDELAQALPTMFRSMIRLVAVEMGKHGSELSIPQFGILDFLLTNTQAVQTDLANHFAKDKSVMLRQLDDMEKAGWIERQMDPNDRRRKNLVVTKAGMEVYRKVAKLRAKVFARVLDDVGKKELAAALNVVNIMNERANSGDAA
ncbi:MAG: MarR family transcriptional regulator [Flavobacteriales bacterium]|nr:MarR family transcriptional regulator [Flavobacteriales bacterium]HPF90894.1 MarR family transcriptional regulator [Flavobacteriales bacterium]